MALLRLIQNTVYNQQRSLGQLIKSKSMLVLSSSSASPAASPAAESKKPTFASAMNVKLQRSKTSTKLTSQAQAVVASENAVTAGAASSGLQSSNQLVPDFRAERRTPRSSPSSSLNKSPPSQNENANGSIVAGLLAPKGASAQSGALSPRKTGEALNSSAQSPKVVVKSASHAGESTAAAKGSDSSSPAPPQSRQPASVASPRQAVHSALQSDGALVRGSSGMPSRSPASTSKSVRSDARL